MRRPSSLVGIAVVLAALACAPAAGAASAAEGTVTLLKGSTLNVTFPDGTTHTQPMRGTFRGTLRAPRRTPPFKIALEVSNAYAAFGPDAPLCGGGRSVLPWRSGFILADIYHGAPPSWVRFGADGRVTLSWTVFTLREFTGCAAPYPGQPDPGFETLTLTGTTTKLGLRRIVLRGGATDVPAYGGTSASFSVKLVTRVDVS